MYNSTYSYSAGMSQQRHSQQGMEPNSQFMPGEPGGFVLPLPPFSGGNNTSRSGDCCQSPMGFVIPDIAAQHQQTRSSYAHMPHGSPGGFMMPGTAPAYQQQQYQQPYQQQYQQPYQPQQQMRPGTSASFNASHASFHQQAPSVTSDNAESVPDGPAPSRYNSRRHRQNTVTFQLAPEVGGGARSIYSPPTEYPPQAFDYGNYQQQQPQQQQYPPQQYGWENPGYNY
ncbi:hypothetical protein H4R99_001350 [Coemansia sp. RSA 1722]|nr:hypothetical protein H4R99_001350 [Coemansia sp. RSA 1722]